jgi:hypothetical protein
VKRRRYAILAMTGVVVLATLSSTANAQAPTAPRTNERTFRGPIDKDIRIGVYINVQPDCSSGPLPTIRLSSPPTNGKVTVKSGKVKATNYKQCLALEVPGYIAFYRSAPGFTGVDTMTLEVKFPNGRIEVQRVQVNVGDGPSGQKI